MSKILVMSDQPVLLYGLEYVLERQGFKLVAFCAAPWLVTVLAAGVKPDLVLLDLTGGLTLRNLSDIHARLPECPVVLWSGTLPMDCVFKTLELGVRGIVQRTARPESLAVMLRRVAAGEMQIGFAPARNAARFTRHVSLTPRERELVGRLRHGLRNKQIAAEMNITEGTVKIYLFRLFHKLGVRTRFELARSSAVEYVMQASQPAQSLLDNQGFQQ